MTGRKGSAAVLLAAAAMVAVLAGVHAQEHSGEQEFAQQQFEQQPWQQERQFEQQQMQQQPWQQPPQQQQWQEPTQQQWQEPTQQQWQEPTQQQWQEPQQQWQEPPQQQWQEPQQFDQQSPDAQEFEQQEMDQEQFGDDGEEMVAPPVEEEKIQNPVAEFTGLDKITGRVITFDVMIDETVQFGALQVTPHVCYTRPPTEPPRTTTFVEVSEVTLDNQIQRIFSGWMFADSPGLNAVEHPVYDVWLTNCKDSSAEVEDGSLENEADPDIDSSSSD